MASSPESGIRKSDSGELEKNTSVIFIVLSGYVKKAITFRAKGYYLLPKSPSAFLKS
jgi:hypothetical protein